MDELRRFQEEEEAQRKKAAEKRAQREAEAAKMKPVAAPPRVNVNVPKQPVMQKQPAKMPTISKVSKPKEEAKQPVAPTR